MKHIGIVAVSSEGASLCYRTICLEGEGLLGPHAHPEISLHNFPLGVYQRLIDRDQWGAVGEMLLESAAKVLRAGAETLICPDNTVHQGLDQVRERSPAPWIHIAEEVTREAQQRHFKRMGILGTRFLMEGPVYLSRLVSNAMIIGSQTPTNACVSIGSFTTSWSTPAFCPRRGNSFRT